MTIKNSTIRFSAGLVIQGLAFLGFASIFIACGEDSSDKISSVSQESIQIVSKLSELPECTKDNDAELMFVKAESSLRICSDKEWLAVSQNSDGSLSFKCSTKTLTDSSGIKIICGGDSIGVVKNGSEGKKGDVGQNGDDGNDGASCTAVNLPDKSGMKIVCGKDSMGVVYNGSNGTNLDGKSDAGCTLVLLEESLLRVVCDGKSTTIQLNETSKESAITNKTITGVAQKGPFLKGSNVYLYELDGKTLSQTGKVFKGKVTGEKGEYSIPNVSLVSQYALLEVDGYFRYEGPLPFNEPQTPRVAINAIVDLSSRTTVNINIVTHLETDRILYLVENGKSFEDAKKQAETEVFKTFGISGDFDAAENLDILKAGDGNAALLAISVMMNLGLEYYYPDFYPNVSATWVELIANIANDIKKDGVWDNMELKEEIAENIATERCDMYSSQCVSKGAYIRSNIEDWADEIPAFELYLNRFLEYFDGFGECSSSNKGILKKSSASTRYFICDNSTWRAASALEYDTYQWKPGKEGECKWGNVNTTRCYVFENNAWNYTVRDLGCSLNLGACIESQNGVVKQGSDNKWYICNSDSYSDWSVASEAEQTLGLCTESKDGEVGLGADDVLYTCDGWDWLVVTD